MFLVALGCGEMMERGKGNYRNGVIVLLVAGFFGPFESLLSAEIDLVGMFCLVLNMSFRLRKNGDYHRRSDGVRIGDSVSGDT